MKILLIAWILIMIIYAKWERRWDKKRAYDTYVRRVKKINSIYRREAEDAGTLDKYREFTIQKRKD